MKTWNEALYIAKGLLVKNGSIHIALLYKKRRLISIGRNNKEIENAKAVYFASIFNVADWKKYPYIHAEIDALSKAWKKNYIDDSYTIFSLRVVHHDHKIKIAMAKPCKNCNKVLQAIGCKVYYSDKNGQMKEG